MTNWCYKVQITAGEDTPTGPNFTGLGYCTYVGKRLSEHVYAFIFTAEADPNVAGVVGLTIVQTLTLAEAEALIYG